MRSPLAPLVRSCLLLATLLALSCATEDPPPTSSTGATMNSTATMGSTGASDCKTETCSCDIDNDCPADFFCLNGGPMSFCEVCPEECNGACPFGECAETSGGSSSTGS